MQLVELQIDAQPDLEFLQNFKVLRVLTIVCPSDTSLDGYFHTLPALPGLQQIIIRPCKRFTMRMYRQHSMLANLSLLRGLKVFRVCGTGASSLWSHCVSGLSTSIQQWVFEDINLIDLGWRVFLPRISHSLRSLALLYMRSDCIGSFTLPVLECLEIEGRLLPEFALYLDCPMLSLFVCTIHHPQSTFSCVLSSLVSQYTASLQTIVIRATSDHVDTLDLSAIQTLSNCKQLRNCLFEGRICISAQNWWDLRNIHAGLDRAIFVLPASMSSQATATFRVRIPSKAGYNSY
jgi:hypothetical protein